LPWAKDTSADAKYHSAQHRKVRAALVAQLKRDGYLTCTARDCVFPTRTITNPNGRDRDGLHAGHNDAGTDYDGPQHNACNIKDAAVRARARQTTTQIQW
jgi:hypothetical protein